MSAHGGQSRRSPWILGAAGLLLALGAVVLWLVRPATTVGDPTAVEESLTDRTSTTLVGPDRPTATTAPETPSVIPPNEVSRLDELVSVETRKPVRVVIGAIGVDAVTIPAGIDPRNGQMEVPSNVTEIAWYRFGPSPGEPGSAVLAAHVDLSSQGPGVFFNLRKLQPGDRITVEYDDGSVRAFVVEARTVYEKDDLPIDAIFSRSGSPVLTLVTCGGGFNSTQQSYDSNVVVYALPAVPPPTTAAPS